MAYTEAQKRATEKYKAKNIKRLPLDVQLDEYERFRVSSAFVGESLNGYIKKAIQERIECEKL